MYVEFRMPLLLTKTSWSRSATKNEVNHAIQASRTSQGEASHRVVITHQKQPNKAMATQQLAQRHCIKHGIADHCTILALCSLALALPSFILLFCGITLLFLCQSPDGNYTLLYCPRVYCRKLSDLLLLYSNVPLWKF